MSTRISILHSYARKRTTQYAQQNIRNWYVSASDVKYACGVGLVDLNPSRVIAGRAVAVIRTRKIFEEKRYALPDYVLSDESINHAVENTQNKNITYKEDYQCPIIFSTIFTR